MTGFLRFLFVLAALLEVAGVVLIVVDIRASRATWDDYSADAEREQAYMQSDLRARLDPMVTRYGFTGGQVIRTMNTVRSLVEVRRWRQNTAVGLLVAGIVVSLVANWLSLSE